MTCSVCRLLRMYRPVLREKPTRKTRKTRRERCARPWEDGEARKGGSCCTLAWQSAGSSAAFPSGVVVLMNGPAGVVREGRTMGQSDRARLSTKRSYELSRRGPRLGMGGCWPPQAQQ